MPLFLPFSGLLDGLAAQKVAWLKTLRAGLYQNEVVPFDLMTIAHIEPCDFSGYIGLRQLLTWGAVSMDGDRARCDHAELIWTHNGGPVSNHVMGFYWINAAGTLVGINPNELEENILDVAGKSYRIVPGFTFKTDFPG